MTIHNITCQNGLCVCVCMRLQVQVLPTSSPVQCGCWFYNYMCAESSSGWFSFISTFQTCRNDIHEFLLVYTEVSAGGPDSTSLAQRRDKWQGLNCSLLKVVQVPVFVCAFINSFTHALIQTGGAHEALLLQGRDSVQVHQSPES